MNLRAQGVQQYSRAQPRELHQPAEGKTYKAADERAATQGPTLCRNKPCSIYLPGQRLWLWRDRRGERNRWDRRDLIATLGAGAKEMTYGFASDGASMQKSSLHRLKRFWMRRHSSIPSSASLIIRRQYVSFRQYVIYDKVLR